MAGQVTKQDQALTRGAQMVTAARSDLDSQLGNLRGKLANLVSDWKGAGGAGFTTLMQRWDEDSKKIISALDGFEANLRASEQTYTSTDQEQAASLGKLASRLG